MNADYCFCAFFLIFRDFFFLTEYCQINNKACLPFGAIFSAFNTVNTDALCTAWWTSTDEGLCSMTLHRKDSQTTRSWWKSDETKGWGTETSWIKNLLQRSLGTLYWGQRFLFQQLHVLQFYGFIFKKLQKGVSTKYWAGRLWEPMHKWFQVCEIKAYEEENAFYKISWKKTKP